MIKDLISGGVIVNYLCTSRCGHCLYNCSPKRSNRYMDESTAQWCFSTLASRGVGAVHIGGGEPMLYPEKLAFVLEEAAKAGVMIEYVETNSSWYKDEVSACRFLEELQEKGLNTLLISISPFHAAYIPFSKTLGVMAACEKTGIRILPWMDTFFRDLMSLDQDNTHGPDDMAEYFGPDWLEDVMQRYWIHMGGRALKTFRPIYTKKDAAQIVKENIDGCGNQLLDTSHFHVDLYKNYIPGLCSGLALEMNDIGQPLSKNKYPLFQLLLEKGISGLFGLASDSGFLPSDQGYISKCDLCTDIRKFFVSTDLYEKELQPKGFYTD
ncbi:MAG: radical SAM protein [Desulfobacterales bacterium]|nr:radical SAM protein [Desulfobacterales bacterium]